MPCWYVSLFCCIFHTLLDFAINGCLRGRPQSTSRYFCPILTLLPLSHFVTHTGTPKSTSHISDPPFLVDLVQKIRTKTLCTNSLSIVRGGFFQGVFVLEGFVWGGFCPFPFFQNTSVTTES